MTSLTLFRQGFTGITAAALAGSSLLAITSNAQAASLDYDCFSRQTGQLVVKAAVDMTSLDLACLASAEAMLEGQQNPNLNVVYTTQPAPAQTSSSGEAFLGGIVGGILGGVIEGSMNRDRYDDHGYDHGHGGRPGGGKKGGKKGGRIRIPQGPKSTVYRKQPGIPGLPGLGKKSGTRSANRFSGLSNIPNRSIKGLGNSNLLKVNRTAPLQRIQNLGGFGL